MSPQSRNPAGSFAGGKATGGQFAPTTNDEADLAGFGAAEGECPDCGQDLVRGMCPEYWAGNDSDIDDLMDERDELDAEEAHEEMLARCRDMVHVIVESSPLAAGSFGDVTWDHNADDTHSAAFDGTIRVGDIAKGTDWATDDRWDDDLAAIKNQDRIVTFVADSGPRVNEAGLQVPGVDQIVSTPLNSDDISQLVASDSGWTSMATFLTLQADDKRVSHRLELDEQLRMGVISTITKAGASHSFWTPVEEGSVADAAATLRLAKRVQEAVSAEFASDVWTFKDELGVD